MHCVGFDSPKITVITVVFNGGAYIERTILSVINQTYPNIEYIVIDGGSTDGTLDIINKYIDRIDFFQSGIDFGIYDAMNIGLGKATGRWVSFMNAGDTFYKSDTVADIFAYEAKDAIVIYGAVEIVYPELVRVQAPGSPSSLWQGMQFSHQAAFIDVAYHQMHPYNIANRIAADLEFFYKARLSGVGFLKIDRVVARVITGGVSEKNRINAIMASCDAVCGARFRPFIRLFYCGRVISAMLRSAAKRSLPRALVKKLILLK